MKRFAVSVPATSANLGPGFDTIGLALELRIRADVRVLDAGANPTWEFRGSEAPTHGGLRDEMLRAMRTLFATVGQTPPPLAISVDNPIPLGRGLGGSAAGAALGLAIGAALRDPQPSIEELTRTVTVLEGHPDNGVPAILGGIVVAVAEGEDVVYARFDPPAELRAQVVVPDFSMPTREARAILPDAYARRDAVYNVGHAALLAAAFASGQIDLLRSAMHDRLHQPFRASFVPGLLEMLALDTPALLGVALSGAGPSVIALTRAGCDAGERMQAIFAKHGVASQVLDLGLSAEGIVREG
ncbi:MAG TPA: homoserine kinase [Candidatus Lustribacter sp.]